VKNGSLQDIERRCKETLDAERATGFWPLDDLKTIALIEKPRPWLVCLMRGKLNRLGISLSGGLAKPLAAMRKSLFRVTNKPALSELAQRFVRYLRSNIDPCNARSP
jgi:hypothetical protein